MSEHRLPTAYHVDVAGDVQRLGSAQGQEVVPILHQGNAPGSPLCQVAIMMDAGKMSRPHIHDHTHVYVRMEQCGEQGALTLSGEELQNEEWVYQGGTLWIPPGVAHIAIYPRVKGPSPVAIAAETRTNPDWQDDVRALPELWSIALAHVARLGLDVDIPEAAMEART